jgi:hypothetical protein
MIIDNPELGPAIDRRQFTRSAGELMSGNALDIESSKNIF